LGEANPDVRWRQRFQNYQKALDWLEKALAVPQPDVIQRAGMVQFFEMTFELGWNVLKDYLEAQGFAEVSTPRAALRKAFEVGLVEDGRAWLKGLEDRNLTSHTYDEATAAAVEAFVRTTYLPLFRALSRTLAEK
jgi:nucleotidyltransferase substrate binding protein (TIGR01987 family)